MRKKFIAAVALMATYSCSLFAAQRDITITANIDSTVEFLQSDGSGLPNSINLDFLPGKGLMAKSISTRFFTNDMAKNISIRLLKSPQIAMVTDATQSIDLDVQLDGKPLTTTNSILVAGELFPGGKSVANGGSKEMKLRIGSKGAPKENLAAGDYSGEVSLVVSQETAKA